MVYCFMVYNATQEREMLDFLGLDPPGVDIDTYLSRLTQAQLLEWKNYWVGIWTNLSRSDIVTFVKQKYDEYYEEPEPEPPEEIDFDLRNFDIQPAYAREGDRIELIFEIKNMGIDHEINCGTTFFFSGGGYLDFPWFKLYNVKTYQTYEITMPIDIGSGWPVGDYNVVCRLWGRSSGGTKIQDLNSVGAVYQAGTGSLYDMLDEKWHDFDII